MKNLFCITLLTLITISVQAQNKPTGPFLHELLPIPTPQYPAAYQLVFDWLPLQSGNHEILAGKLAKNETVTLKMNSIQFEGQLDYYAGYKNSGPGDNNGLLPSKGKITFQNGDYFVGNLSPNPKAEIVFLDGLYTFNSGVTMKIFPAVAGKTVTREYQFSNGDIMQIENDSASKEKALYSYKNGGKLMAGFDHHAVFYYGKISYTGPDGTQVTGLSTRNGGPDGMWTIKKPGVPTYSLKLTRRMDASLTALPMGVVPDDSKPGSGNWVFYDKYQKKQPVQRIAENIYCLKGDCQEDSSTYIAINGSWIYLSRSAFHQGKPDGMVNSKAWHAEFSYEFELSGLTENFFHDGATKRKNLYYNRTIDVLMNKGFAMKSFVHGKIVEIELDDPDKAEFLPGFGKNQVRLVFSSKVIYIGEAGPDYSIADGKGTAFFPDGSRLESDNWRMNMAYLPTRYYRDTMTNAITNTYSYSFYSMGQKVLESVSESHEPILAQSTPAPKTENYSVSKKQHSNDPCRYCKGSGATYTTCMICYGKGYVRGVTDFNKVTGRTSYGITTCTGCSGKGTIYLMSCLKCEGTGYGYVY